MGRRFQQPCSLFDVAWLQVLLFRGCISWMTHFVCSALAKKDHETLVKAVYENEDDKLWHNKLKRLMRDMNVLLWQILGATGFALRRPYLCVMQIVGRSKTSSLKTTTSFRCIVPMIVYHIMYPVIIVEKNGLSTGSGIRSIKTSNLTAHHL